MPGSVGRDFMITATGQAIAALQGLVVLPIMIHFAGEATYGAFVLTANFATTIYGLLSTSVTYRYRRGLISASSMAERRRLFEPQFTFLVLSVSAIIGATLLGGAGLQEELFEHAAEFSSWAFSALLFSHMLSRFVQDYYQYTRRFLPGSILTGVRPIIFVVLIAGAAAVFGRLSLDTVLTIQVAAILCVSLPLLPTMLAELGVPRLRLTMSGLAEDMRVGLPLLLELVIDFLLGFSDRYLIALFLTVADVGRYQPAYTLASVVLAIIGLGETVLIPLLGRMIDAGHRADAERMFATFMRFFLVVAVPFAVGALMVGPSLIAVLTTTTLAAASRWVVPLVAVGTIFYGIMRLASLVAYVLGRTRVILGAGLVGAGVNLAINLTLLPILEDITVPGAATLAGYGAGCVYVVFALRKDWPMPFDWPSVLRACASAGAMGAGLLALGFRPAAVSGFGPAWLAVAIVAGALIYFGVLKAIGGFGRREIDDIKSFAEYRLKETNVGA